MELLQLLNHVLRHHGYVITSRLNPKIVVFIKNLLFNIPFSNLIFVNIIMDLRQAKNHCLELELVQQGGAQSGKTYSAISSNPAFCSEAS